MEFSKDHLHTLRHMLGINTPDDRIPRPYRNYAAVSPGDSEFKELECIGVVEKYKSCDPDTQYDWFRCTKVGKLAAMRSHRDIRRTKAQRRYSKFFDLCDCYPDLTFFEFLTNPEFVEARENV